MSAMRQTEDGRWLPMEPLPEPFGILWERLWHDRRRSGEWKWSALIQSWKDARAITKLAASVPAVLRVEDESSYTPVANPDLNSPKEERR